MLLRRAAVDLREVVVDAHVAAVEVVEGEPDRRAAEDHVEQRERLLRLAARRARLGGALLEPPAQRGEHDREHGHDEHGRQPDAVLAGERARQQQLQQRARAIASAATAAVARGLPPTAAISGPTADSVTSATSADVSRSRTKTSRTAATPAATQRRLSGAAATRDIIAGDQPKNVS